MLLFFSWIYSYVYFQIYYYLSKRKRIFFGLIDFAGLLKDYRLRFECKIMPLLATYKFPLFNHVTKQAYFGIQTVYLGFFTNLKKVQDSVTQQY